MTALAYPLPNALPLVSSLPSPVSVASPLPPSPTDALSTGTASRSVSVSPTASAATDLDSAFSPTSIGAATTGSDETDDAIASLPPLSPALSPRAAALPAVSAKAKVEQLELPSLLSTTTTSSTQSTVNLNMLDAALGMGMGLTLPLGGAPNFPPLTDEFEGLAFSMPLFSPSSTRHSTAASATTPSSAYAVTAAAAAAACNAPPVYPTPSALAPPPSAAMFPPLMPMALPMPTAGSTVQLQRYLAGLQLEMHHLQSQLAIAANVNTKLSAVSPTAPMAAAANDFKVKVERRSPQPPVPTAAVAGSLAAKYNLKHSPQLSSSNGNAKPKATKSNKQHAGMKRERSPQSRSPSTDPFTSESDADSRISSPAGQPPRTLAYTAPRPAPAKPAKVSGGFVVAASKAVLVPRKSSSASLDASDPDNQISIGQYTRAERRAKIERYRAKRATRNFGKKISYGCRKNFADNRPRVGGRFISVPTGMFNGQSNSREIAAAAAASASSGSAAAAAAASTDAAVAAKASANAAAAGAPSTSNKRRRVNPAAAAVSAAPTPMQMVMAAQQQQPMMQSLPLFV